MTWADNALTTSPHTITMVDAADLPVNFAEAYICNWNKRILGVDGPCLRFMDAHGGVPPIRQMVEVGREGDSTLLGAPSSCRRMAQPVLTSRLALAAPYTTCASFIRRCREQLHSRTAKGSKQALKQRRCKPAACESSAAEATASLDRFLASREALV